MENEFAHRSIFPCYDPCPHTYPCHLRVCVCPQSCIFPRFGRRLHHLAEVVVGFGFSVNASANVHDVCLKGKGPLERAPYERGGLWPSLLR